MFQEIPACGNNPIEVRIRLGPAPFLRHGVEEKQPPTEQPVAGSTKPPVENGRGTKLSEGA
jgi:hypothetical protein